MRAERQLYAGMRGLELSGADISSLAFISTHPRTSATSGETGDHGSVSHDTKSFAFSSPHSAGIVCLFIAALACGCSSPIESEPVPQTDSRAPWDANSAVGSDAGAPRDASTADAGDAPRADAVIGDGGTDGSVETRPDGGTPDAAIDPTFAWVLSYSGANQDLPSDSLHLAYSVDGLRWTTLNAGQPVYQLSGIGTNHIRDPFILRKLDGTFVLLASDWTLAQNDSDYWNHPSGKIVIADSTDLISFTSPRLVTVTTLQGPNSSQMHAWAPEAFFDDEKGRYAILWSGNDTTGSNHIYVSYTSDFESVSNPILYFDPGSSVIDASLLRAAGRNHLFFKDDSAQDIQIARSPSTSLAPGVFTRMSTECITRGANQGISLGTGGPFAIQAPNQNVWYLFADLLGKSGLLGAWKTTDLDAVPSSWTAMSSADYSLPPGARHANAVRVTQEQLDAIIRHYGVSPTFKIRSTYSENGAPCYVAHSWYHAMITSLDDAANGQLPDDFRWKVVPGLADPTDPTLVSFVPERYPDKYLRINSMNPGLYPACTDADPPNPANRGAALCRVPGDQRDHLAWIDTYIISRTFRSDATFRKVAALNGDSSMVSLQWYGDPKRYLRHREYQLFATPVSTSPATDYSDASFKLE